jgi:hypothetical protein
MDIMWFTISQADMDPVSRLTNTLFAGGRAGRAWGSALTRSGYRWAASS